jgi:hypothetical protein
MASNVFVLITCPLRARDVALGIVQFSAKSSDIISRGLKMNMNSRNGLGRVLALALCMATPLSSFADFKYTETTQLTGGSILSMAKFAGAFSHDARKATDPVETTVIVKGNRMARINPDHTSIIDLDAETITEIYPAKKQYTVMTFAEMKQEMEAAMQQAQAEQAKQQAQTTNDGKPMPQMKFTAKVTDTGASKQVAGLDAKEAILRMTMDATDQQSGQTASMAMNNDMWMVPDIPGYDQVREFNKRFAAKMGDTFSGAMSSMRSMMAQQPGMLSGMGDMMKEMQKLKGIPVSQVMRMGMAANGKELPSASEAPLPPQPNGPSGSDIAQNAANNAANSATNTATSNAENSVGSHMGSFGGVASSLGGFGGFHKKKKPADTPAASPAAATPDYSVLMESTTQMTGFSSSSVDVAAFAVPAGYAKVAANDYQKK